MNRFSDERGMAYFIFFSLCLPLFFSLSFWNSSTTWAEHVYFYTIGYFITFSCGAIAEMIITHFIDNDSIGWPFGTLISFIILTGIMYSDHEKFFNITF